VQGISYGGGVTIELRIRDDIRQEPRDEFNAYWITSILRPDLLVDEFPEKRGQLIQLPKLANMLKAVGDDFLRGDLSILPEVRTAIAKAREEGKILARMYDFNRAEVRSQEAFRKGEYSLVIRELEPYQDFLNASSRKRLEIAKSRL